MDLKLLQKDVAEILKVDEQSIIHWENNVAEPMIRYFPNITSFLGYEPLEFDLSTFGGKLQAYRYRNGLTHRQLGNRLNVDGCTIGCWEKGINKPQNRLLKKLEEILNISLPPMRSRTKLVPMSYPEKPLTLGEHIRKKRIDMNLFQHDVAKIIKVRNEHVAKWELNKNTPSVKHYPVIIEFLGYFPFEIDTSTFGGKVKAYRYMQGMSRRNLAKMFRVAGEAIIAWEDGRQMPKPQMKKKVEEIIKRSNGRAKVDR